MTLFITRLPDWSAITQTRVSAEGWVLHISTFLSNGRKRPKQAACSSVWRHFLAPDQTSAGCPETGEFYFLVCASLCQCAGGRRQPWSQPWEFYDKKPQLSESMFHKMSHIRWRQYRHVAKCVESRECSCCLYPAVCSLSLSWVIFGHFGSLQTPQILREVYWKHHGLGLKHKNCPTPITIIFLKKSLAGSFLPRALDILLTH